MIKFLPFASSTMILAVATLMSSNMKAQECVTFDFPYEIDEVTIKADIDRCGADVFWEEPTVANSCDSEITIVKSYEQGQYFETGYHVLNYSAYDEMDNLVGQSQIFLDVFDDKAPFPQGNAVFQEDPEGFPEFFTAPDVYLEGDFGEHLIPVYTAMDNCLGEITPEIEIIELYADSRMIIWTFTDGSFASEMTAIIYSNVGVVNSIDNKLSAEDQSAIAMDVYPNPVESVTTVSLNSQLAEKYDVKVYSMSGQIVYQGQFNSGENKLNVEFLPSGFYTIQARTETNVAVDRFIKK